MSVPVKNALRSCTAAADRNLGLLLLLPGLVCLAVVIVYPVVYNLAFSFTNKNLTYPNTSFVGLENYLEALGDTAFWGALVRTLVWTFASVGGQFLLGLTAAIALDRVRHGGTPFRLLLIVPWTFPAIVMAFSWRFMLDSIYGVTNAVLMALHLIDQPVAWFANPDVAMPAVVVMNIWFGFPFMTVVVLAGLQAIPKELYEAARVDGASFVKELRHVILPGLRGVAATVIVLRTIWVFNNFDFIYLTTGGGPTDATTTLPVYAFQVGWLERDVGGMAAVAVVMIAVLLTIVALYQRAFRAKEEGTT